MKNNYISVVVPVYNVEQYLDKCIESIVAQTYKELEIILVDDGSTDKSAKICDLWQKKDKRIKVIHKENGGLSDARNFGIEASTSEYITFIDSDDWIPKDSIELLYSNMKNAGADISAGKIVSVYTRNYEENININIKEYNVLTTEEALEQMMYMHTITNSASGKIYKKEFFDKIRYPYNKHFEDLGTTYKVFSIAKKIVVTATPVYFYYQNNVESIMHKKYSNKRLEAYDFALEELNFINEKYPKISASAKYRLFYECLAILNDMPYGCDDKNVIMKTIKEYRGSVIKDKNISAKQKMLCFSSFFGQFGIKQVFKYKAGRRSKNKV